MNELNLYSLLEMLYEGDNRLFSNEADVRKPSVRRTLLKLHFAALEKDGALNLDVDDAVLRGLVGMRGSRSRGGSVTIRKNVIASLSARGSDTYKSLLADTEQIVKENLGSQQLKTFAVNIRKYVDMVADEASNIEVFGESCLYKVCSTLRKLLDINKIEDKEFEKYAEYAEALNILFICALLQDRTKDITFLFEENQQLQPGFIDELASMKNNICMMDKEDAESELLFPFYKKLYGARHLTMMVYAGTSFLTGLDVGMQYMSADPYKEHFRRALLGGTLSADIILVNPFSSAGKDSVKKMRQHGGGMEARKIILHNIRELFLFKKRNPLVKINLYLTDISLPYGILMIDTEDTSLSFLKWDSYDPFNTSDYKRKSFYLYKKNPSTINLYKDFRNTVEETRRASMKIGGWAFDFDWIKNRSNPIIHRGRLRPNIKEHSIVGFFECLKERVPMEIDLLFTKDDRVILGRDTDIVNKITGIPCSLSSLTLDQIRNIKDTDYCLPNGDELPFSLEQTMLLSEFLSLVAGRVPILLELKAPYDENIDLLKKKAEAIADLLRYYNDGQRFAIHSANPRLLALSKKALPLIPHGMICWNFEGLEDKISEEFISLHRNMEFSSEDDIAFIDPDFLSVGINDDTYLKKAEAYAKAHSIPYVVWTVKNEEQEFSPSIRRADNIIIECGKTFETNATVSSIAHLESPGGREILLMLSAEILSAKISAASTIQKTIRKWIGVIGTEDEEKIAFTELLPNLAESVRSLTIQKNLTPDLTEENGILPEEKQNYVESINRLYNVAKKMLVTLVGMI